MHLKYSKGCNFRFVLDLDLNNRECIYIKKQKRNNRKFPWSKLVTFHLMPSYFFWEALTTLTQPSARALYFPVIWLNKFVLRCNESLLFEENWRASRTGKIEDSLPSRNHPLRKTHGLGFHSYFHQGLFGSIVMKEKKNRPRGHSPVVWWEMRYKNRSVPVSEEIRTYSSPNPILNVTF